MPLFSAFSPFGLFEFEDGPSEAEKNYDGLVAAYRDPKTGLPSFDMSEGTYQEAKVYGYAMALGEAAVTLRAAGNELRPETSYAQLEAHEDKFGMSPGPTDTVVERQAALAARQKASRGPIFAALYEAMTAILGDDLIAIRSISTSEDEAWPAEPGEGPGLWLRNDAIAKSMRTLTAVARTAYFAGLADQAPDGTGGSTIGVFTGNATQVVQSFLGNGQRLSSVRFYLDINGAPTGNVVAHVYAHDSATFGSGGKPTGSPLATSDILDVAVDIGVGISTGFTFTGANRITLEDGVPYFIGIEYLSGTPTDYLLAKRRPSIHAGNSAIYGGVWTTSATLDMVFELYTSAPPIVEVAYENWNRTTTEVDLVAGDILCIDPGNLGLTERVEVLSVREEDGVRYFSARFTKTHSAGVYVTTGPMPIWTNTKRHVLLVVTAAAAVDPKLVRRVHAELTRIMRAPTTWAIVQPTTPGAATVGPFTIGATAGSPLGAVPVESITV